MFGLQVVVGVLRGVAEFTTLMAGKKNPSQARSGATGSTGTGGASSDAGLVAKHPMETALDNSIDSMKAERVICCRCDRVTTKFG